MSLEKNIRIQEHYLYKPNHQRKMEKESFQLFSLRAAIEFDTFMLNSERVRLEEKFQSLLVKEDELENLKERYQKLLEKEEKKVLDKEGDV